LPGYRSIVIGALSDNIVPLYSCLATLDTISTVWSGGGLK